MKRLMFILIVYAAMSPVFAQSEIDSDRISLYIEHIKKSYNIPGITVSVTGLDSTIYLEHFGKINPDEQILIGSCSKSFTALLILKLQQKGLLNINDPVVKYLNWFQYANKSTSDKIVIKDLLQHTSGIPAIYGRISIEEDSEGSTKNVIESLLNSIEFESPSNNYEYSNINYRLLGFIIEQVTRSKFGEVLNNELLIPFHLRNTSGFVLNKDNESFPRSYNYLLYYPIIPFVSTYNKDEIPAGYIASTASDMAIYLRELMKSYTHNPSLLIEEDTVDSLFTPNGKNQSKYGFGWFISEFQNTEVIYHAGLVEGFNTCMIILPEKEKAIFVAVNSGIEPAFEIAAGIFHILINVEPRKFSTTVFYLIRSIPILVFILILILIAQLRKWRKRDFQIGFSHKLKPNVLLIMGILFGLLWIVIFPILYQTTLQVIIKYDPTSGISLILITISVILISIISYLNNQPHDQLL